MYSDPKTWSARSKRNQSLGYKCPKYLKGEFTQKCHFCHHLLPPHVTPNLQVKSHTGLELHEFERTEF